MDKIYTPAEGVALLKEKMKAYGDGISTGIPDIDHFFTFIPEQLYLLSASTHIGKTTFALNLACNVANQGRRVLFASLEQGVFIYPRIASMNGGKIPGSLHVYSSDELVQVDRIVTICSKPERYDLLIIDHLHFIAKGGKGKTEDIDEMVAKIQNMAKKLQIPVLLIAHVRKLNEDREPNMDDLRDSSSLAQVPSVVMFLYRKKNEQDDIQAGKNILQDNGALIIHKNRIKGITGARRFVLDKDGHFDFTDYQFAEKIFGSKK